MIKRLLIGSQKEIIQTRNHSFNLDTVLLAKFLKLPTKIKNILDVGTGNGALLIYASEMSKAKLIGVEIQKERYELAKKNILLNHIEDRTTLIFGDYLNTTYKNLDCIITNPPFFKTTNEKHLNQDPLVSQTRHELTLSLNDLIKTASKQLKYGGYFYMVHRPDRLAEIMKVLNEHRLIVKRLKFVHPYAYKKANHVLIQCIKDGNEGLILEPPLFIYKDKHIYSQSYIDFIKGESHATNVVK